MGHYEKHEKTQSAEKVSVDVDYTFIHKTSAAKDEGTLDLIRYVDLRGR